MLHLFEGNPEQVKWKGIVMKTSGLDIKMIMIMVLIYILLLLGDGMRMRMIIVIQSLTRGRRTRIIMIAMIIIWTFIHSFILAVCQSVMYPHHLVLIMPVLWFMSFMFNDFHLNRSSYSSSLEIHPCLASAFDAQDASSSDMSSIHLPDRAVC